MRHIRPIHVVLAATLAVALSAAGVAAAQVGSDPEGDTPGEPEISFLYAAENEEAAHLIPAIGGPPPASEEEWVPAVGDVSILRDDLYALDPATNGPTGDQLGTNNIHCTVVHADLEAFVLDLLCRGVITLPRGTMTWEGKVTFSEEAERAFAVAITGGTGLYADAGGRAIIDESDDEDSGDTIYEVRLLHLALQP